MIKTAGALLLAQVFAACVALGADGAIPTNSKVFVESKDGFDLYLTKAIHRKHVPLAVVSEKDQADFVIAITASQDHTYNILQGRNDIEEASVKIIDQKNGKIVFTYDGKKRNSFNGKQSLAELVAKHLKNAVSRE